MATVKKSKKKVIVWILVIALLVSGIVGAVVTTSVKKGRQEVSLNTIGTASITQTVSSTGDVTAGLSREYKSSSVATVKQVFVKLGDEVKKGDMLATFDTTQLDSQVASLNATYKSADSSYKEAVKHQKAAKVQLESVNKQIKETEKLVKKLTVPATTTTTKKTTKATTTSNTTTAATQSTTKVNIFSTTAKATTQVTTVKKCDEGSHDYKYSVNSASSAAGHVVVCSICGDTKIVDHNFNKAGTSTPNYVASKTTDDYHVVKCSVCGYEKYELHTYSTGIISTQTCSICGKTHTGTYTETDAQIAIAMVYVAQVAEQFEKLGAAADQVAQMRATLEELAKDLAEVSANVNTMTFVFSTISSEIMNQLTSGNFNADTIAQAVGKAVTAAIKQGMVEFVDSGVAVQMIETAVKNVNWKAIGKSITESQSFTSTAAQIQLTALYAQKEIYTMTASLSTVNAQKQALNASRDAYETVKEARDQFAEGWKADFDGTITAIDISEGSQTTALQTGIKLENMDKRVVTISLGEYDIHKVKVGMKAVVKTAYGEYEGTLESIAPTATGGSSSSLMDSVGSMAGISGLSSLTASGAGVECKILVDEPDENIIIGFDADVTITTGTYTDVPCVPIESIVLEKEGTFVYLYDEVEGTVTKTQITTGATSDTSYEITSGLAVGQRIVATPATDYKDDTFKVRVVEKKLGK